MKTLPSIGFHWKHLLAIALFFACALRADAAPEPADVAGRQIELCMVGDSITWYNKGDYFRTYLLKEMPNLAFLGTHSACNGFSHAGEGGNNTLTLAERIHDVSRVPDSRYYHLLIGANDCVFAKDDSQIPRTAQGIVDRIVKNANALLARPGTEKIFLGTILPCAPDSGKRASAQEVAKYEMRDRTGQAVNVILRRDFAKLFPSGKAVLIDYEPTIRALPNRKEIIRLHPLPQGYAQIAPIAAKVLKANTTPLKEKLARFGVEVTNLYDAKKGCTAPLLPGWYTVSFQVEACSSSMIAIHAGSVDAAKYKAPYRKDFSVRAVPGKRASFPLMTGYEGYNYNRSPIAFSAKNGKITDIMVEKMRPSGKPSVYGSGSFVDAVSSMSLGEKFVPAQ